MAAVSYKCDRRRGAIAVDLEVDQTLGEDEDVALVEDLGEELVIRVGRHEADEEGASYHREHFRGPRVVVGRVHATMREVDAREGDAERVEPCKLIHIDGGDAGADLVIRVARHVEVLEEAVVEEVVCHHLIWILANKSIHVH